MKNIYTMSYSELKSTRVRLLAKSEFRGSSNEVFINQLDELESSEEQLNTFNLAFRVINNDLCYLDVFDKNLELIEELFSFKNYIIKEVF